MRDWQDKQVTIVGLGRTGTAAARYVQSRGGKVLLTESNDTPALQAMAEALRAEGVAVEIGGHSAQAVDSAEVMILSPGVPTDIPLVLEAEELGLPVVSELEAVCLDCQAPIYAVTGTNGKTTTTALLHHVLGAAGKRSILCGNNDMPLSEALHLLPTPDAYVVEVSSYQLETAFTFAPRIAAVLNVTPDHPRHGTLAQYAAIKNRIFRRQGEGDISVVNADDPLAWEMEMPGFAQVMSFSANGAPGADARVQRGVIHFRDEAILSAEDLPIPGRHNLANVLAVVAMARAAGIGIQALAEGIRSFSGVPHRLESVRNLNGVAYCNDSKSTNIDSLRVALESFTRPLVLIAGGVGKGAAYGVLEPLIRQHVKTLVLIGQDGPKMAAAWGHAVPSMAADTMADAVQFAGDVAEAGDTVLLSPGCASFDWYNNFEERGADFRACVAALREPAPTAEDSPHGP